MGCDIHMRVEYRYGESKPWTDGDYYRRNPYYTEGSGEKKFEVLGLFENRNYFLFALLAGVMNDGEITPICNPKGVPNDCCKSVDEDIVYWGYDGHSHSYFTLKELREWYASHKQVFNVTGYISKEAAKMLDEDGVIPSCWCAWTNDGSCVKRTWDVEVDVLKPLIKAMEERAEDLFYLEDYDFEKDVSDITDSIRIVFWFDN